jgi:hypothetical protein
MRDQAPGPETTVVIVVWGRYVQLRFSEALASIQAQTQEVVVVVVDNASEVQLPPLSDVDLIRSARRLTLGGARNLGLAQVHTPNVIFWDADDVMLPGAVERLQAGMAADSRLIAFAMAFLDDHSGERHRWPRPWIARLVRHPRLLALVNAIWAVYPIVGPVIMRTESARQAGAHAEVDCGDARCLGAAMLFGGRVGWTEEPGCLYLQHLGSNLDRNSGAQEILRETGYVRERLRSTPNLPRYVSVGVPALGLVQWAAVGAHLAVTLFRRVAGVGAARAAH